MARNIIDITNQKFGSLLVIQIIEKKTSRNRTLWLCVCDCGKKVELESEKLRSKKINSCGCKDLNNITGQKFNRLTALQPTNFRNTNGSVFWDCICDCGNMAKVTTSSLRSGHTKSCGCLHIEQAIKTCKNKATHGKTNTSEYNIWLSVTQRCLNINNHAYSYYGGRGITICDRWLNSFENFYIDMGPRPSAFHSIDRIDNNGNYEPSNCRWATKEEQSNNRRNNHIVIYKNKQYSVMDLAKELGINYNLFRMRIYDKWDIKNIIDKPPHNSKLLIMNSGGYSYDDFNNAKNISILNKIIVDLLTVSIGNYKMYSFWKILSPSSVIIAYWY